MSHDHAPLPVRLTFALLAAMSATFPAFGGTAVDVETREQGQIAMVRIEVDAGFAVARSPVDAQVDLLFDSTRQTMFVIDHGNRSYTVVNEPNVRQAMGQMQGLLEAMQSQIALLPDNQRRQLESLLEGGGGSRPALVATDRTDATAGIACRVYQVVGEGRVLADACLGEPGPAAADAADVATLRSLMVFSDRIADSMRSLLGEFGDRFPDIEPADLPGLPVHAALRGEDTGFRVTAVSPTTVDPARLRIPEGYVPRALLAF